MKNFGSLFVLVVVICMSQITVVAQFSGRQFLSIEETQKQVEGLGSVMSQYKILRQQLKQAYDSARLSESDSQSENFRLQFVVLAQSYLRIKEFRNSRSELWLVLFLVRNEPSFLLQDGWTEKNLSDAQKFLKEFDRFRNELRKIDSRSPTDATVEGFMLKFDASLIL